MATYNIMRKHTSDNSATIFETISGTKRDAAKFCQNETLKLSAITHTPHTLDKIDNVFNIRYCGHEYNPNIYTEDNDYGISFWYERVTA